MLFKRRKRLEELAKAEADGRSFWTPVFDDKARYKIVYAMNDAAGNSPVVTVREARALVLRDEGLPYLTRAGADPLDDFFNKIMKCPDGDVPMLIEAIATTLRSATMQFGMVRPDAYVLFVETVNEMMREHRISFEIIDGRMVEHDSREMHVSVVEPALQLLGGQPRFANVETAYRNALDEIAKGNAADAITDAGTALQQALTVLGATGNALGPLIKDAERLGLVSPHDQKLLQWVSADRSVMGDSHQVSHATIDDAWLTVHIVGAVILRLAADTQRRAS